MPATKPPNGLPWFDITNLPRRHVLERATKACSRQQLEQLLESGDIDAVGRAVLRDAIEVRKHFKCD